MISRLPNFYTGNGLSEGLEFNTEYYKTGNDGYVTYSDLFVYANRFLPNIFYQANQFTKIIFNDTINDITTTAFSYITYIPNIILQLTNISYDEENDITDIEGNVKMDNTIIDKITGSKIVVDSIICHNIRCNNINVNVKEKTIGGFICYNNISYPIVESTTELSNGNCVINLLPNFMIRLYNNGSCVGTYDNNTNATKYNLTCNSSFNEVRIYHNYVLQ